MHPLPDQPTVSIILAVYNEAPFIDQTLNDLTAQDYRALTEIIVADGGSSDGTLEVLATWGGRDARLHVIDNPRRRQAFGLNLAAERATAEILVRVDGHSRYARDYVSASVAAFTDTGGAVGGRMNPVGSDRIGKAVAAAMNSPLTMGPARFHHATEREEVDTVYLGAFPRDDFLEMGGIRAFPSGSSEDADFYYRWRKFGRRVFVDPAIQSEYAPRNSIGQLWQQYWRYGQGKSEMLWVNGRFPSWRPLAPMLLVLGIIAALVAGLVTAVWWPLLGLVGAWLTVLVIAAIPAGASAWLVIACAAVMHLAYGLGELWGLVKGPVPHRRLN